MCDLPVSSEVEDSLRFRLQSLQELTECTEKCQQQLNGLFEAFGWSNEMNSIEDSMEVCQYDHNHRVPKKSMARHEASCRLNKMGYSREEQGAMYDTAICYEKTKVHTLVIDKHTQQQIILQAKASAPIGRTEGLYCQSEYSSDPPDVPQNHKRSICDFTVADRLALYDHVIREAGQPKALTKPVENDDLYVDLVAKLKKDEEQNGPKSHLEVLAEMRDYKRRRQSYRAKNVHITKKTYTEVIREVIDVHSGELARVWEEEEELGASRHSSHRRRSEERRSVSVESRSSLSCSRRRRHRSPERSPDRERGKDRDREWDKDKDKDKDKDRDRERDKDQDRDRDKDKDKDKDKDQERDKGKDRDRERDNDRDRDREQVKDKHKDKHKDRDRDDRKQRDLHSPEERRHERKKRKRT
ncbi:U11/U12 small nuclear ribonucleoprotein 48 kDa protein isoform X2 [Conger conger]|uniref:U11/U12 small nuclear ribonucleoprotein 48 kDa protein isoform X2 n=1 Tax=Conger conger TaxID=82655 RepID=UPI002A5A6636|nr:U11/U12 small nuclear ribonucleoprotein 48 kDa protein isoform X2 [Conger conger]